MSDEEQLRRRFEELDFPGEPAMASTPFDDAQRGRRKLRQRRGAAMTAGLATVALATAGVAYVLPTGDGAGGRLQVTGGGSTLTATSSPGPTRTPEPTGSATTGAESSDLDEIEFPATRQILLDTAIEHLDPEGIHLPDESTGFNGGTGGTPEDAYHEVGTKLGWVIPGEDGEGLVQVLVTTPGYTERDKGPIGEIGWKVGCEFDMSNCTKRPVPGTSGTAWVAEADPEQNLELGVLYERPDGSLVGIGVYSLFGNNSLTPVSGVDIDLDEAFGFVTDPDLRVDPDEAAEVDPVLAITGTPEVDQPHTEHDR